MLLLSGMEIPGWIFYAMRTIFKLEPPLFAVLVEEQVVYFRGVLISFEDLKEKAGVIIDEDGGWSTATGSYAYGYCPPLN